MTIKHGTYTGYRYHKCRCALCKGWNAKSQASRRQRRAAGKTQPPTGKKGCVPVSMPDGTMVASITDAARSLGVSTQTVRKHQARYGHLRNLAPVRHTSPGTGTARGPQAAQVSLGITLPQVDIALPTDPGRPETAPSGSNYMVGVQARGPRTDIGAVIAAIRESRDEFLAEKGLRHG